MGDINDQTSYISANVNLLTLQQQQIQSDESATQLITKSTPENQIVLTISVTFPYRVDI